MNLQQLVEASKSFLFRRQQAYQAVFSPESPPVQTVLADLARFCRANKSTFHPNDRAAAQLDGRREVWLRITQHLNLTQDELWKLYGKADSK